MSQLSLGLILVKESRYRRWEARDFSHGRVHAEFISIIENTANLKEFITIRDNDPVLAEVRANNGIGIPLFVNDDGSKTLDINEAFAWIGQSPVKDEELVER